MSSPVVLAEIDRRGVATVTLNRPEVNNAYNTEMLTGLMDAFAGFARDARARVVVLRGNGPHFQAGADLKWLQSTAALSPEENDAVSRRTTLCVRALNEFPKPTVALVHGGCFGGGVGIVAAADIVVASDDAIFAITEVRWGVVPGPILPQLNAAMGARNVRRYALSAERFDAHAARAMGLVHEVCPVGGLDAAAAPIIDALLMNGPEALAECKALILDLAGLRVGDDYVESLAVRHSAKRRSAEAAEGFRSFIEKRRPAWYPG